MQVRAPHEEEADEICALLRASITHLCEADHRGDPATLALWLANKTPENVTRWLANPANRSLVVVDGRILSVGCVTTSGEIILNYVAPEARFRGASHLLLESMERVAREEGNTACSLQSTRTAHAFYLRRGYVDEGSPSQKFGLTTYPMTKRFEQ